MGWSDSVDEKVDQMQRQIDWLLEQHGNLLVGARVRCLTHSVRVEQGVWPTTTHQWVVVRDRIGTVKSCNGGYLQVQLDPDYSPKELVVTLAVNEVERVNEG